MKKLFLILFLTLAAITVSAQTEHFKFMGIPLDGSISNFTSKLQAKGFTISPDNKDAPVGIRCLKGVFYSKEVKVVVFYDPKTYCVYEAKVVFEDSDLETIKNLQQEINEGISVKYHSSVEHGEKNGHPQMIHYISLNTEFDMYDAAVSLWISGSYPSYLHVEYIDLQNLRKYDDSKNADL